MEAARDEWA
eukprot:gene27347-biopygen17837